MLVVAIYEQERKLYESIGRDCVEAEVNELDFAYFWWKMEGTSLAVTPTWAVATVITVMVSLSFLIQLSLKQFEKWLDETKRKALLSAMDKIREELMLFGLLSLLMGHWTVFVANICIKTSNLNSRFYPCSVKKDLKSVSDYVNSTVSEEEVYIRPHNYCSEGHESFASYESLELLHRLMFVLATTHVCYSFSAIALAMIKIYSWRNWENQAKSMALLSAQDSPEGSSYNRRLSRMSTFISHQTSHPWSGHKILVWLLCFSRQFWSSISEADYMALRLGFITTHRLPLTYDFHNYMLRSMEEEFRDIVGISVPLWVYAICCIFLDFHGTYVYFWVSFLPAIIILIIGTKLHRVAVKLAVEVRNMCPEQENQQFNLRDELFWFGKPRLLLWLIQLTSFQNAFEMATFIWSLWEVKGTSCFMDNRGFVVVRLGFGVVSQFWCSFITFPLYVIITQMGTRFKKILVSENVWRSLHGWQRRVKARHGSSAPSLLEVRSTPAYSDSKMISLHKSNDSASPSGVTDTTNLHQTGEILPDNDIFEVPSCSGPRYAGFNDNDNDCKG